MIGEDLVIKTFDLPFFSKEEKRKKERGENPNLYDLSSHISLSLSLSSPLSRDFKARTLTDERQRVRLVG